MVRMKWDNLEWRRRFRASPRTYGNVRGQFDRDDEWFLRREELAGGYRIALIQINMYRDRKKSFRIEVWSLDQYVDAPITVYEESTQMSGEQLFERVLSEYNELVTEGISHYEKASIS